ncbi:MAG: ComEC/Rec2 family competence protein, partial [Alphaproteobacteria bacterium]|nr:ComEC/Rec2 family competence protein [Alphaproteobacteria bacterium]
RQAWFMGLGATGKAEGPVARLGPPSARGDTWHDQLTRLMLKRMPDSAGGIGASFITGDRGAISQHDEVSMRASGLTHLVSVSGLHITVAVTAAMWLTLRLLALIPGLALRWNLLAVAAACGAFTGLFYTWLTGAEVPTIRSVVAALLVIAGLVLGREAVTLRLVASGAMVILLLWPESLMSPSFQLSFIAVTSLIAFHEHPEVRRIMAAREGEDWPARLIREGATIMVTGVVVELALAPILFFHFHRAGIYGSFANIIGIPLTTFFIMPMEVVAIVLEPIGLSAPFWWLAWAGLHLLIRISYTVAAWPGAVQMVADVPTAAFILVSIGGLWLMLWKTRARFWGLVPVLIGCVWGLALPAPDLLITGDGRHMVLRADDGSMRILRARAHEFVRQQLAQSAGFSGVLTPLAEADGAQCNDDLCRVRLRRGGRAWVVSATRSPYNLPWDAFIKLCSASDIMVSDRHLPTACTPRWLKADRAMLQTTGGLAIDLDGHHVTRVKIMDDEHPWLAATMPLRIAPSHHEDIGD